MSTSAGLHTHHADAVVLLTPRRTGSAWLTATFHVRCRASPARALLIPRRCGEILLWDGVMPRYRFWRGRHGPFLRAFDRLKKRLAGKFPRSFTVNKLLSLAYMPTLFRSWCRFSYFQARMNLRFHQALAAAASQARRPKRRKMPRSVSPDRSVACALISKIFFARVALLLPGCRVRGDAARDGDCCRQILKDEKPRRAAF